MTKPKDKTPATTDAVSGDEQLPPGVESVSAEAAESGPTTGPRVRGKYKPREKNKEGPKKRETSKADPGSLAKQIVGLHLVMAGMTGLPELVIDEKEGRILADATIRVADEYGVILSGKAGAALQLFAAAAMVYAPRLIMIQRRMHANGQAQPAHQDAAVHTQATPPIDGEFSTVAPGTFQ